MKKYIFISFFLFKIVSSAAQTDNKLAIVEASVNPGGVIDETGFPEPETLGSYYIEEDWRRGEIVLKSGIKVINQNLKYDLENHRIEVQINDLIKICPLSLVESFTFSESDRVRIFMNKSSGIKGPILLELLYEGKNLSLLVHHNIQIKESDYIPAIDMGSKNHKIVKIRTFIVSSKEGDKILKNRIQKNQDLFKEHFLHIKEYIKINKLSLKSQSDIIEIIKYYESLTI
ncbi:MAG: hypothetical protein AAGC64_14225 [Bacteroidota bacterium]